MTTPIIHHLPLVKQPISIILLTSNLHIEPTTTPPSSAEMVQKAGAKPASQSASAPSNFQLTLSHSQPILVQPTSDSSQTSFINSSSSVSTSGTDNQEPLQTLLALPEDNLSREERRVKKLLKSLHNFTENPSKTTNDFIAVCELLKESSNNNDSRTLSQNGDTRWLPELSKQTVAFLTCANSQSDDVIGWSALSMSTVAQICYALKASLEPSRYGNYFSDAQLLLLTPALRGITRKLINHLHDKQLMDPNHNSYGDVLSVLSWLVMGLQWKVPDVSGVSTKLLAGSSKGKIGIDAIFKQALCYFSVVKFKALDTRQLGKLVHAVGRVLSHQLLNLQEAEGSNETLAQRLSETMLKLCGGNALLKFCIWGKDNFGVQELKKKPVDPVTVSNLAEGLLVFISHLFAKSDKGVGLVVNNTTGFIEQVLQSGKPSKPILITYASFLKKAHKENFDGTNRVKIAQLIKLIEERIKGNTPGD